MFDALAGFMQDVFQRQWNLVEDRPDPSEHPDRQRSEQGILAGGDHDSCAGALPRSVSDRTDEPAAVGICLRTTGCRMPNAESVADRLLRRTPIRPLVLLAIDDDDVRARFAYELNASGFNVAVTDRTGARPSIILATLSAGNRGGGLSADISTGDPRFRGVPVIAIAPDASNETRDLARRHGCVAVCVTTCSGATLAAGMRAVLDRSR